MTARRAYPSDISEARWAPIGPTLTAWQQARLDRRPTGEPARTHVRDVLNAIFYVNRTGLPWKSFPMTFRHTPRSATITAATPQAGTWIKRLTSPTR